MTAAVLLTVFATGICAWGGRALQQAAWPIREPALGIVAWQSLTLAVPLSLVLAGLILAMPERHFSADLAAVFHACAIELRHRYGTPDGALLGTMGILVAIVVTARGGYALVRTSWETRRARRARRAGLVWVTRPVDSQVAVLEHAEPHVFCMPGRQHQIVLTRGALSLLSPAELEGVLAHERRHLRAHHHLALTWAAALELAFGWCPLFSTAREQVAALAEMHADDAVRGDKRRDLATALLRMSGVALPVGVLGASAVAASARVLRLSRPAAPLPPRQRLLVTASLCAVLGTPVLLALVPAVLAVAHDCCAV